MNYRQRSRMLVIALLLAVTQLLSNALPVSVTMAAQTTIPLAPFRSVELHRGVRAILLHGPTQRVSLLKGSLDYSRVTIDKKGTLIIDKCKGQCPPGYEIEVEIISPAIDQIFLTNGGRIESRGSFPPQLEIGVAVRDGGTIDVRSMAPDRVTASVEEGGTILTIPQTLLSAKVANGGIIVHWGDARVESSIRNGGVVTKGIADEADKPISELSTPIQSLTPVPSRDPIRPIESLPRDQRSKTRTKQRR